MTTAAKSHVPSREFPDFGRDEPPAGPAVLQTSGTDVLRRIPLDQLRESRFNPRKTFDPAKLKELALSLLTSGQLQPLIVRPWPQTEAEAATARAAGSPAVFEIGAGHRRRRAAEAAGLAALDCIVRDMDNHALRELITFENLGHDDLHALDEAQGFADAMKELGYTVEQVGERSGKGTRYVYDSLTLLKLAPEAKKLFREGRFERSHAVELARLTPKQQDEILQTEPSWNGGALFVDEHVEEDPTANKQEQLELRDAVKPVTVRELKHYINDHYRARPDQVDPVLFPETAEQLAAAAAAKRKVVHITYDHQVPHAARDPKTKTVGKYGWKRADGKFGSKTCAYAVLGFVAAGPHRQEAFPVCINKEKCEVHWRDWQRESARRKKEHTRQTARGEMVGNPTATKPPKPPAYEFGDTAEDQTAIGIAVKQVVGGLAKRARAIEDALKALPGEILWNFWLWLEGYLSDETTRWMPQGKYGSQWKDLGTYGDEVLDALELRGERVKDLAGARRRLAVAIFLSRDYDPEKFEPEVDNLARILRAQAAKCEQCKCTEAKACPGGCAWDSAQLKKGHYVCTACTKKAPAPRKAAAKKKAKKGKR